MQGIQALADLAFANLNSRITDEVFLTIQNDRELMQEYLRLVMKHGVETVNQEIGKAVKVKYCLTNDNGRQNNPKSTLIKSHQPFK